MSLSGAVGSQGHYEALIPYKRYLPRRAKQKEKVAEVRLMIPECGRVQTNNLLEQSGS